MVCSFKGLDTISHGVSTSQAITIFEQRGITVSGSDTQYCAYPCPCGCYQDAVKECTCYNQVITRYQNASLARCSTAINCAYMHFIEVPRVNYEKLSDDRLGEPSVDVQARVQAARERHRERFKKTPLACNADMRPAEVREFCQLDETSNSLMQRKLKFAVAINHKHAVLQRRFRRGRITGCSSWPAQLRI